MRLHSIREDKGVETGLVDKDGLCLVVRTSVANRDGGFVTLVYMLCESIARYFIPQCIAHVLGTEQRLAFFITLFFTYPKAELAKQH